MSQALPTDPQPERTEFVWNTAERLVTDDLVASIRESSQQNTDLDMCGAKHAIMARNIAEDVIVDLLNAGWVAPDGTRVVAAPAPPAAQAATEMCSCYSTTVVRIHSPGSCCGDGQHERLAEALAKRLTADIDQRGDPNAERCATAVLDALRKEPTPVAQPATVDDTALIERAVVALAEDAEIQRLRTELEHAKAALAGDNEGIRLWMLDCAKVSVQLRERLAATDERIAVLQRSWDRAREANTAWLDGKTVVLPEAWHSQITNAVYFNYGPEPRLIDQLCELIDSWRPATERATPTAPRVFRKGDPEPSDVNQVKDDGDRRWCRNRRDRSWYLRDIAGPFLMWDELLDRVERLTEVPTEGGNR